MSEPESGPGAPHTEPEPSEEELGQPRPPEPELEEAREEPQVSVPEAPELWLLPIVEGAGPELYPGAEI